jgi:heme-degrading monooxygenase HmoA
VSTQIVRLWHGRVPTAKADAYFGLMRRVAIADYRAIPGNLAAHALRREEGDITHVVMLTFWESLDAIRAFASEPVEAAKYYDFDSDYLLEQEPTVTHYEIAATDEAST